MSNITTVGSIKLCDKALIQQYLAEIRSDSNPRNFIALGYVNGSNDVIGIRASGAFDLEDVRACVDESSVVWMFWRVIAGDDLSHRIRFITITASGEKLTMFKRTRSMHHSFSVLDSVFGHGHAAYTVSKPEDITEDMILQKLSLSVNYDKTKRVILSKDTGVIKGSNGEAQASPVDSPEQQEEQEAREQEQEQEQECEQEQEQECEQEQEQECEQQEQEQECEQQEQEQEYEQQQEEQEPEQAETQEQMEEEREIEREIEEEKLDQAEQVIEEEANQMAEEKQNSLLAQEDEVEEVVEEDPEASDESF